MYYYPRPYPYYRRYYNINPYYYRRYYYPFYNVVDSQIADVDQSIINYGDMTDVIQDSDIYQSMVPKSPAKEFVVEVDSAPSSPSEQIPPPAPPTEFLPSIPPEIPIVEPPPINLP